ncbi:MAG: site-2 protease family protein [Candidatus Thermoplasmatota archaeon]|nr:site-2 protease family protein [Candidatus Thermoplasmatota archaeon]
MPIPIIALTLLLLSIWIFILYVIKRKENEKFSMWGPVLMWKTEKGKKFIKRVAEKKKFWKIYADFGIALSLVAMVATFALILWNVKISFQTSLKIDPRIIIGLPGINPVIPVGYGILALAIAIIIHEFSHGILAMVGKIKVKALGLIFLIVPIGAFVEPDEEELEKVSKRKRSRVFAAGPTSNMILAFVCALIFSSVMMGSISPKVDGIMIMTEVPNSPFDISGVNPWSVITSFNGKEIKSMDDFEHILEDIRPGKMYNVTLFYKDKFSNASVMGGIVVAGVVPGHPAATSGMKKGDILYTINGTEINNISTFYRVMNLTEAGEKLEVGYYWYENGTFANYNASVVLKDKYEYYEEYHPRENKEEYKNMGFLGLTPLPLGITYMPVDYYPKILIHPLSNMKSFFFYLALPFLRLSPFPHAFTAIFFTPVHPSIFWPFANILYWVFWLNFAIGTFNVLPAIPLDGGYIFKDSMSFITKKIRKRWEEERVEKVSSAITTIFSVIVLFAIIAMILVPRLRALI